MDLMLHNEITPEGDWPSVTVDFHRAGEGAGVGGTLIRHSLSGRSSAPFARAGRPYVTSCLVPLNASGRYFVLLSLGHKVHVRPVDTSSLRPSIASDVRPFFGGTPVPCRDFCRSNGHDRCVPVTSGHRPTAKLPVSIGFSLVRCSVAPYPKGPDDFRIVEARSQAKGGDMVDAEQSEVVADRANDECVSPRGTSKPSQVRPGSRAASLARLTGLPSKQSSLRPFPWRCQSWPTAACPVLWIFYRLAGGAVGSEDPMGIATRLFFAQRRTPTLGLPASTSTRPGALGSTRGRAGVHSVTGPAPGSPRPCT